MVRLAAAIAGDVEMIKAFQSGEDLHSVTAEAPAQGKSLSRQTLACSLAVALLACGITPVHLASRCPKMRQRQFAAPGLQASGINVTSQC